MDEYTLLRIAPGQEQEVGKFTAPTVAQACEKHLRAWRARGTPFAVVMVRPDGIRHSYRDSAEFAQEARATQ